jgi:sarcosine oxidase subunit gamma
MTVNPALRRSPVTVQAASAQNRLLTLADLSALARWGLKGRGVRAFLGGIGAALPAASNVSARQDDGSLIAQLSPAEVLVLPSLRTGQSQTGEAIARIPDDGAGDCYPAPRADSHAWFLLRGERTPQMFAKLCGVDLALDQFANFRVAQTSVARLSAIVIRNSIAGRPAFSLLADSASAQYLWDCLLDAMTEFAGTVSGAGIMAEDFDEHET